MRFKKIFAVVMAAAVTLSTLNGFHGFSDNGQVLFLFSYLLGTLFGSAFLLELPARAARGIVFPVFPV